MSEKFEVHREAWMDFARCKGEKPSTFVMDKGQTAAKAQKFCRDCSVREPCYDYAVRTNSVGVWGGRLIQLKSDNVIELFPLRPVEYVKPKPVKDAERTRVSGIFGSRIVANFSGERVIASIFGSTKVIS